MDKRQIPAARETEDPTSMEATGSDQPSASGIPDQETEQPARMGATGSGQQSASGIAHPETTDQRTENPTLPQAAVGRSTTLRNLPSTSGLTYSSASVQGSPLRRLSSVGGHASLRRAPIRLVQGRQTSASENLSEISNLSTDQETGEPNRMGATGSGQQSASGIVHPEIPDQETGEPNRMGATGSGQPSASGIAHPEIPDQDTEDATLPQAATDSNTLFLSNLPAPSGSTYSGTSRETPRRVPIRLVQGGPIPDDLPKISTLSLYPSPKKADTEDATPAVQLVTPPSVSTFIPITEEVTTPPGSPRDLIPRIPPSGDAPPVEGASGDAPSVEGASGDAPPVELSFPSGSHSYPSKEGRDENLDETTQGSQRSGDEPPRKLIMVTESGKEMSEYKFGAADLKSLDDSESDRKTKDTTLKGTKALIPSSERDSSTSSRVIPSKRERIVRRTGQKRDYDSSVSTSVKSLLDDIIARQEANESDRALKECPETAAQITHPSSYTRPDKRLEEMHRETPTDLEMQEETPFNIGSVVDQFACLRLTSPPDSYYEECDTWNDSHYTSQEESTEHAQSVDETLHTSPEEATEYALSDESMHSNNVSDNGSSSDAPMDMETSDIESAVYPGVSMTLYREMSTDSSDESSDQEPSLMNISATDSLGQETADAQLPLDSCISLDNFSGTNISVTSIGQETANAQPAPAEVRTEANLLSLSSAAPSSEQKTGTLSTDHDNGNQDLLRTQSSTLFPSGQETADAQSIEDAVKEISKMAPSCQETLSARPTNEVVDQDTLHSESTAMAPPGRHLVGTNLSDRASLPVVSSEISSHPPSNQELATAPSYYESSDSELSCIEHSAAAQPVAAQVRPEVHLFSSSSEVPSSEEETVAQSIGHDDGIRSCLSDTESSETVQETASAEVQESSEMAASSQNISTQSTGGDDGIQPCSSRIKSSETIPADQEAANAQSAIHPDGSQMSLLGKISSDPPLYQELADTLPDYESSDSEISFIGRSAATQPVAAQVRPETLFSSSSEVPSSEEETVPQSIGHDDGSQSCSSDTKGSEIVQETASAQSTSAEVQESSEMAASSQNISTQSAGGDDETQPCSSDIKSSESIPLDQEAANAQSAVHPDASRASLLGKTSSDAPLYQELEDTLPDYESESEISFIEHSAATQAAAAQVRPEALFSSSSEVPSSEEETVPQLIGDHGSQSCSSDTKGSEIVQEMASAEVESSEMAPSSQKSTLSTGGDDGIQPSSSRIKSSETTSSDKEAANAQSEIHPDASRVSLLGKISSDAPLYQELADRLPDYESESEISFIEHSAATLPVAAQLRPEALLSSDVPSSEEETVTESIRHGDGRQSCSSDIKSSEIVQETLSSQSTSYEIKKSSEIAPSGLKLSAESKGSDEFHAHFPHTKSSEIVSSDQETESLQSASAEVEEISEIVPSGQEKNIEPTGDGNGIHTFFSPHAKISENISSNQGRAAAPSTSNEVKTSSDTGQFSCKGSIQQTGDGEIQYSSSYKESSLTIQGDQETAAAQSTNDEITESSKMGPTHREAATEQSNDGVGDLDSLRSESAVMATPGKVAISTASEPRNEDNSSDGPKFASSSIIKRKRRYPEDEILAHPYKSLEGKVEREALHEEAHMPKKEKLEEVPMPKKEKLDEAQVLKEELEAQTSEKETQTSVKEPFEKETLTSVKDPLEKETQTSVKEPLKETSEETRKPGKETQKFEKRSSLRKKQSPKKLPRKTQVSEKEMPEKETQKLEKETRRPEKRRSVRAKRSSKDLPRKMEVTEKEMPEKETQKLEKETQKPEKRRSMRSKEKSPKDLARKMQVPEKEMPEKEAQKHEKEKQRPEKRRSLRTKERSPKKLRRKVDMAEEEIPEKETPKPEEETLKSGEMPKEEAQEPEEDSPEQGTSRSTEYQARSTPKKIKKGDFDDDLDKPSPRKRKR